jgi:DNA repair protein RadC
MSIHDNHRQRVKNRYENYGLDVFDEHEALELLLFYCIPRRDTNEIAHKLIDRFKTFGQVLDAPMKELEKVEGVGHSVALYLKLLRDAQRYYGIHNGQEPVILNDLNECGRYLCNYFDGYTFEVVYMLGLDAKRKVLCCREVGRGNVNSTAVSVRKIVDMALAENVTSVVLAHNHPSGVALPSYEDIQTTHKIQRALAAIDVVLADHVIISENDFVSMAQSQLLMKIP